MKSRRLDVGVFAIAFAIFGLVAFALLWSGDWAYAALAKANGSVTTFRSYGPCPPPAGDCFVEGPISLEVLLDWHRGWAAYVTGTRSDAPVSFGRELFTPDEYSHMADVRNVFRGAETLAVLALGVAAYRLWRAGARSHGLRLVRDGGLAAAGIVAIIGVLAVVAFDPLFLLFHQIFFPQGNFLFDPATSNLLRLYPEWYWQGVTAGVGMSFIAVALVMAAGTQIALRRASKKYTPRA